ncbi:MAG TPA: type II CAAX endopeptidase family protein [Anaerolineae bacterium]|nr:type II CAAX endopeptidase family protein [Anaerolineae bacterium]
MINEVTLALPPQRRELPSLLVVNLYLVLGILIILVVGQFLEDLLPPYWMGILAEFVLAGLTLLFIRGEKLPVRETLRWRWPGWPALAASVVLAVGLWIVGVGLNVITMLLLGYTTPMAPSAFPQDGWGALGLLVATVVAAPLCEEVMFRGYVQRAYERWGGGVGALVGGVIFALYHLRFQGGFALLPVSLVLGVLAWRSHSLLPGILLHAVYNSIAALLLIVSSFLPLQVVGALIALAVCGAVLLTPLTLLALWWLWQRNHPPAHPASSPLRGMRRWAWGIPLLALLLIYGYAAVSEVILGRFPELLAVDEIVLQPGATWDRPQHWSYVIHNTFGEAVGTAECILEPPAAASARCRARQEAFAVDFPLDVPALQPWLTGEARAWEQRVAWDAVDLRPATVSGTRVLAGEIVTVTFPANGRADSLRFETLLQGSGEVSLPPDTLLAETWPWRLMGLPFEIGYGSQLSFAWLDEGGAMQVSPAYVGVVGGEPVWTPAGAFVAWKVVLKYTPTAGEETTLAAWYTAEAPHMLVRYDEGGVSYLLAATDEGGR